MRMLFLAVAIAATLPAVTTAQTSTGELVGRTCIGPYNINGYNGTIIVRFLPSGQPGTMRAERGSPTQIIQS